MSSIPPEVRQVRFDTKAGRQTAFFAGPSQPSPLAELWVVFGGNGSLALDWWPVVKELGAPGRGFLLVDYPGYGSNPGHPTPMANRENGEQAVAALSALGYGVPERLDVIGHSLGAAVALDFASRRVVRRVVLFAPFTSMEDMAARMVTRLVAKLVLRHRYDNRGALKKLAENCPNVRVLMIHGKEDTLIPFAMSEELGRVRGAPGDMQIILLPGAGHDSVVLDGWEAFSAWAWK